MSQSDFVSRGQALVAAGQFQEAVKVCRLGLLGRPTTVEGRVVLGSALLALKRYDEVLAEMRVALELDHSAVAAHALRAEALIKKGDLAAAMDALGEAHNLSPNDPRIAQLYAEAQRGPTSTPGVGFIGANDTKHYPNHAGGSGDLDGSESFTKPTSISSPGAPRRTSGIRGAQKEPTPSPQMLSVGDKSGTVEVDPDLEGVQLDHDADFDDVAAPPRATPGAQIVAPAGRRGEVRPEVRSVKPAAQKSAVSVPAPARSTKLGAAQAAPKLGRGPHVTDTKTPTMDLLPEDDSDILEVDETNSRVSKSPIAVMAGETRKPGATAVRNAVQMPSGPIDISGPPPPMPPMQMAQMPPQRGLPGVPPMPLPPAPQPPRGNPIAAALPTVAAMHHPQPPNLNATMVPQQQNGLAGPNAFAQTMIPQNMGGQGMPPQMMPPPAQRQTMLAAAQPPPPLAPQPLSAMQANAFPAAPAQPNWNAVATAAANEPTAAAVAMDPALQAMLNNIEPMGRPSGMPIDPSMIPYQQDRPSMQAIDPGMSVSGPKTGIRKARSKLQIAMWILVGVVVIGGGVFAGFQIRAMRLNRQVAAARKNAMELTKNDTFANWTAARDELSRIVQASGTDENIAALAKARALIAYEFDDGVADAKVTVDALKSQSSVEAHVARAYLALAQGDAKEAHTAAQLAVNDGPDDASANYVAGQVALMQEDLAEAVKRGKVAVDKDPRPLFLVGLAKIYAAQSDWATAQANLSRALGIMADQPSAVIERAIVIADSGGVVSDPKSASDARSQLAKLVGDPKKTQLSPAQVAFGNLALAEIDFARNEQNAARADVTAAGQVGLDDQRFAESVVETLYDIGQLGHAGNLAKDALKTYPKSNRLHLALARVAVLQGNGSDALAALKEIENVEKNPPALAERGNAKLASGDLEGARKDLDAAQKAAPKLEAALVGRAWVELAAGDPDLARKALDKLSGDTMSASPAVVTINAAIMRRDPTTRDKAKQMLEALVAGAPGPDVARAQLEVARIYRDMGDFTAAHKAYGEASKTGNFDAKLESGLLAIDDRDPNGGRETLDALFKEAGPKPGAALVLETARARMLAGDHEGAATLLATAEGLPNIQKWKFLRERGRLALRRSDTKTATQDLGQALEGCGSDPETFMLAADAAADTTSGLGDKLKSLVPTRLKGQAEAQIINGKLALANGKVAEAETAYRAARDQMQSEKAAPRRIAQANYGLAVIAYDKQKDAEALADLKLVLDDDPSIYDAYLFKADLDKNKVTALEAAKTAVKYNGDYPRGWNVVGKKAALNGDKATLQQAVEKLRVLAPGSDELKELEKLK